MKEKEDSTPTEPAPFQQLVMRRELGDHLIRAAALGVCVVPPVALLGLGAATDTIVEHSKGKHPAPATASPAAEACPEAAAQPASADASCKEAPPALTRRELLRGKPDCGFSQGIADERAAIAADQHPKR